MGRRVWVSGGTSSVVVQYPYKPAGSVAETFPRWAADEKNPLLTSQRPMYTAMWLAAGDVVSSLTFWAGATGIGTGVHQYFALYSAARARLAVSADDTSTAWAAETAKTLAMTTPYVVPSTGLYYAALLIDATTPPHLYYHSMGGAITNPGSAPLILCGQGGAGQTAFPATEAALGPQNFVIYAYAS